MARTALDGRREKRLSPAKVAWKCGTQSSLACLAGHLRDGCMADEAAAVGPPGVAAEFGPTARKAKISNV